LLHVSPTVQGLPSLQGSVLLLCAQPAAGTQKSVVQTFPSSQETALWIQAPEAPQESTVHRSPSSQLTGVPLQAPLPHTSPVVQGLPSLQGDEFGRWVQVPELQASFVHGLPSSQFSGVPG